MISRRSIILAAWLFAACGGAQPSGKSSDLADSRTIEDGEALLEQGKFTEAAEVFGGIVKREPNDAKAHYYLGLAKKNLGDLAAAEEHYRLAIGYDANLPAAHNNLGILLLEKGDLVHAESELHTYLQQQPDDAGAFFNYGLVLEAMGKVREARENYEKAAELDPEDPAPWLGLGDLARKEGDFLEALSSYRKGRKAAPQAPELTLKEGQTLLDLKKLKKGAAVLEELAAMPDVDPGIVTTAGILLAKFDEDEKAMVLYEAALASDDAYAAAHLLLANALARKKRFAKATEHYERFLEISPDAPEAEAARRRLDACRARMK